MSQILHKKNTLILECIQPINNLTVGMFYNVYATDIEKERYLINNNEGEYELIDLNYFEKDNNEKKIKEETTKKGIDKD